MNAAAPANPRSVPPPVSPLKSARLGIAMTSYGLRFGKEIASPRFPRFNDALDFLAHAATIGAGGVQTSVRGWDADFARRVRAFAEPRGLFVEAQIGLPKDAADVPRFSAELLAFKMAGGAVARVVVLGGRRYEVFSDDATYQAWRGRMWQSLRLAEPVVRRARLKLAIENHKDVRIEDMHEILKRLDSEAVGVCVDTGNSIALLEDPMEVVEALAPHVLSVHLKDMAMKASPTGFLLSEVPLGEGVLDLARMVERLRRANPRAPFSLEMITRDPLVIPCLTDVYWATLKNVPARDLARTLALVRTTERPAPLPAVKGLNADAALAFEEDNVKKSLAFAQAKLGL